MNSETRPDRPDPGSLEERIRAVLGSLEGVISAEPFMDPNGGIDHIRVVSSGDLHPGRVVRDVEAALLTYLDLSVDHRRITVLARGRGAGARPAEEPSLEVRTEKGDASPEERTPPGREPPPRREPSPTGPEAPGEEERASLSLPRDGRLVLDGHRVSVSRSHEVEVAVDLRWRGRSFTGLARSRHAPWDRLRIFGQATLAAVREIVEEAFGEESIRPVGMELENVGEVTIFGRAFVAAEVHLSLGRARQPLYGTVVVEESPEEAAITATLQAVDRRVRAILEDRVPGLRRSRGDARVAMNPFDIWG